MASRDMKKCEEIRKEFVLESGNKFIYCRKCDLASQESIRQFASRFNSGNFSYFFKRAPFDDESYDFFSRGI